MGRTITPATPGHPYDNGIYQADTIYTPEPGIATSDLPAMCGQLAPVGETTRCLRLIRTWHLHSDLADITKDINSLSRMRNAWRARNLIGNIEFRIRRLTYQIATWEIPACACGNRALAQPTHNLEEIYPACTC